jgi:RNA polymerase sigma-70 factor (ECF subfamily)
LGAPQDSIALNTRDQDWTTLIRNSARGDQSALGELYDATSRLVFGLVLRIVGDRASAEEVLLDVYTQAWRQAAHYDEARGAPLAWLMTIARSRAIDRIRSSKHDQQKDPLDAVAEISDREPSPEQATVDSERRQLVRAALETLPAEQREVLELAYYSGLSHSEIASRLGQPLGTVKTRTRLAMIKLRDMLRPVLEGEV